MVQWEGFWEKPRLDNVLRAVLRFIAGLIAAKPVVGGFRGGIERGFAAIRCAAGWGGGAVAGGPGGGRRKARGCKSRPGFTEENQGRLWLGEVRPN